VSRREFEEAIGDLTHQTLESIDQVLSDGEVEIDEINQVLMVGGSSRIPAIWELVANYLDTTPHMSINPEEVVALGASVQAAIIAGIPIDAILVDVTPHALGMAVAENFMGRFIPDRYQILIHRNTTIPVSKSEAFNTLYPEQDTIEIKVYQGEEPVASENTPLGNFLITDLEPERPGELAEITVRFDMDVNGMLTVTAKDRKSGKEETIVVEASRARLSEKELLQAQTHFEQIEAGEDVSLSPEGVALLERAERLLGDPALGAEDRQELGQALTEIQRARQNEDQGALDDAIDDLLDLLFDIEA
jgi:molecular chaperone DnaK